MTGLSFNFPNEGIHFALYLAVEAAPLRCG